MKPNARKSFRKLLAQGKIGKIHFGNYKCSNNAMKRRRRR